MNRHTLLLTTFVLLVAPLALFAMPTDIAYQGTLKEKGLPAKGTKIMVFRLTNQDGTQVYWSSPSQIVTVSNGLFSAHLNPTGVDWQNVIAYIEITIEGQILLPREPLSGSVYSLYSNSVADGAVTTVKIADGAVTASKIDPSVSSSILPSGMIIAFGGSIAPIGWLACDGRAVSRSTYASLFSVIGVNWGTGNSISTFNLPDLRGRAPIGTGQGNGLTDRALGQVLGEEAHVLNNHELPSHQHEITDPGHAHYTVSSKNITIHSDNTGSTGMVSYGTGSTTESAVTGITIQKAGGGAAHNNMQPSAVVNYIIKT